jgi:hypothetical protein
MENLFIGIAGIIGAGKTTLATSLGNVLGSLIHCTVSLFAGLPVHFEEVIENAYLQDFYADMAKYSFPLQVCLSFLTYLPDLPAEQTLPPTPANYLARKGRGARSHNLRGRSFC